MVYYSNNLTLFSSEIDPRRNLFIDDIEQYLSSLTDSSTFDDFKRFTPSETVSVRIACDDSYPAVSHSLYQRFNYCRVTYSSAYADFAWYYFVTSIEMVADGTLAISLQLDALNTFRNWKGALTDRTFVTRQLVNRWDESGKPDNVFTAEDITGEIIKESEYQVASSPCYLIYRNSLDDESGEPALYVTKDAGIKIHDHIRFEGTFVDSKANSGSVCYKIKVTSPTSVSAYMPIISGAVSLNATLGEGTFYVGLVGNGTNGAGSLFICQADGTIAKSSPTAASRISGAWLEISGVFEAQCSASVSFLYQVGQYETYSFTDKTVSSAYSAKLSDVDRTSSDIVKIIQAPFTPELSDFGEFEYRGEEIFLRFSDIESQLRYSTKVKLDELIASKPSIWKKSQALLSDPKMLSSAFSYYKIVYDSYSATVSLDNILADSSYFTAEWIGSSSMSSSSVVMLHAWDSTDAEIGFANYKEDYPMMLSSDRNNEIPIYSVEWLNYLRNGYNYDKKSNAMSIATSVLSTVGSLVMGVATIATGGASAAATIPAAVGMAGAAVSGWTSTASTINSQLAKETQMKNQSFSVSSVNDLSLFKAYGNATVKVEWWCPREDYKRRLGQLFFYRGYAVNEQYEPSLDIRTSFDYIECVPSWSGSFIQRTPPQFISLLNDRLAQGVTIIHHCENAWDIAQEKGNLEK